MKTKIILFALLLTGLVACKKPYTILPRPMVITNTTYIDTLILFPCTGLEVRVDATVENPSVICEVYNASGTMSHSTQWFDLGTWSNSTGNMYNNGGDKMTRVRVYFAPGGAGFIHKCTISTLRL